MSGPLAVMYPRWQRVRLVVGRGPGEPAPYQADEVIASLCHALGLLGCTVDVGSEPLIDGTNIYFFAHLLSPPDVAAMPPGSIIYNLEQIFEQSPWLTPSYRSLLARFTVWDYSRRNLADIGVFADPRRLHLVPIGYMPQLSAIPPAPVEDIDVLFYGAVNPRRRAILGELERSGLRVRIGRDLRGAERDQQIARARIVLNQHVYPTAVFEIVRVSYLLANAKAVVAECGPQTEIDDDIRAAVAAVPYDRLCETVHELLIDDGTRRKLARRGQAIFARRSLPGILARAVAATEAAYRVPATSSRIAALSLAVPRGRPAARGAGRRRVLFHAINGNGLGHLVRLSLIAGALGDDADAAFFSTCRVAKRYWPGRLFGVDDRLDERFGLQPGRRNLLAFHLAMNRFSPDVVVFDTHWPYPVIGRLRERGIPAVLVIGSLAPGMMDAQLRVAVRDFASVLIASSPAELEDIYRGETELLDRLAAPPCLVIGPVARTAGTSCGGRGVIFTLGGGGEYQYRTATNSVDRFIEEFRTVALALRDGLGLEPVLAAGPFLDRSEESLRPFRLVRSERLHEMFGPGVLVVARGGYNTTWEAVAAGARLVVVGDHTVTEDIGARGRFLESEGLARQARPEASAILEACLDLLGRPPPDPDHPLRRAVNGGLAVAREEILAVEGGSPRVGDREREVGIAPPGTAARA